LVGVPALAGADLRRTASVSWLVKVMQKSLDRITGSTRLFEIRSILLSRRNFLLFLALTSQLTLAVRPALLRLKAELQQTPIAKDFVAA
jgi:hypothetical protein